MILKRPETNKTTYNLQDLLGSDEIALSKAFSYLLATDRNSYFHFLKFLGVPIKNTLKNYKSASIITEKKRNEGRTDIELSHEGKYHIIIECKIRKGKVIKQRTQYLTAFEKKANKKILCILTQERDTNKQIEKDIIIRNTSWLEVIDLFNNKFFTKNPVVTDFLKFVLKNYKMKILKEILIQDLSDKKEIQRFKKYCVYRRKQTFGTPLYFAPYFTRSSGEIEGITKLSRILGIITFKPKDIENFRSDLESFTTDNTRIDKWIEGIKLDNQNKNHTYTYYFLDVPLTFKNPLKKDRSREKGRGKNWIAAKIPPNRCVSFTDFIKHIPELMNDY